MPHPKFNKTSFKPGRKKTGGRKAGVRNKTTRAFMDAIIEAAESVGSDGAGKDGIVGFLEKLAINSPAVFCSLLGRVMLIQENDEKIKRAGL